MEEFKDILTDDEEQGRMLLHCVKIHESRDALAIFFQPERKLKT